MINRKYFLKELKKINNIIGSTNATKDIVIHDGKLWYNNQAFQYVSGKIEGLNPLLEFGLNPVYLASSLKEVDWKEIDIRFNYGKVVISDTGKNHFEMTGWVKDWDFFTTYNYNFNTTKHSPEFTHQLFWINRPHKKKISGFVFPQAVGFSGRHIVSTDAKRLHYIPQSNFILPYEEYTLSKLFLIDSTIINAIQKNKQIITETGWARFIDGKISFEFIMDDGSVFYFVDRELNFPDINRIMPIYHQLGISDIDVELLEYIIQMKKTHKEFNSVAFRMGIDSIIVGFFNYDYNDDFEEVIECGKSFSANIAETLYNETIYFNIDFIIDGFTGYMGSKDIREVVIEEFFQDRKLDIEISHTSDLTKIYKSSFLIKHKKNICHALIMPLVDPKRDSL